MEPREGYCFCPKRSQLALGAIPLHCLPKHFMAPKHSISRNCQSPGRQLVYVLRAPGRCQFPRKPVKLCWCVVSPGSNRQLNLGACLTVPSHEPDCLQTPFLATTMSQALPYQWRGRRGQIGKCLSAQLADLLVPSKQQKTPGQRGQTNPGITAF